MEPQRSSRIDKPAWIVHPASSRALPGAAAPLATVFTSGTAHEVRHANASYCRLVGLPPSSVLGHPLADVFEGHAADAFRTLLDMVLESGNPNVASDVAIGKDAARYTTVLASPIEDESTQEPGLLVHIVETTERVVARVAKDRVAMDAQLANEALVVAGLRAHEAAERARAETERWNALVDSLSEGVAVLDGEGRVVLVNAVGRKLLHLDEAARADYIARCALETLDGAPLPPERHPARRALAGESFSDEELRLVQRDGHPSCRLVFSGSSIRDGSGTTLAINVFRDVTELRKLEEVRGEFVSLVSHDLRSPLQALLGSAELLLEALAGVEAPRAKARADTILRVTKRMASMVDDLYRSSELEASNIALSLAPTPVSTLLGSVYETIADAPSRARIRYELAEDLPPVQVDPPKMERALLNLVTNALKYSSAEVTVRAHAEGDGVALEVIDRGDGIPADELPHLFEKYRRTKSAQRVEGMGLGLYITKRIVELHGGQIICESVVGEGSRFVVTLPAVAPSTPHAR